MPHALSPQRQARKRSGRPAVPALFRERYYPAPPLLARDLYGRGAGATDDAQPAVAVDGKVKAISRPHGPENIVQNVPQISDAARMAAEGAHPLEAGTRTDASAFNTRRNATWPDSRALHHSSANRKRGLRRAAAHLE
jgi:hypothetical protein